MAATYAKRDTAYFVFDIESMADGDLVSRLRYPGESLAPQEAIARYRAELLADSGKDFIPYTYQLPVSLVIAKVGIDKDRTVNGTSTSSGWPSVRHVRASGCRSLVARLARPA